MTDDLTINLDGELVPVTLRRNSRARRLILRVEKTTGEVKLTLPNHVGMRAAQKFLTSSTDWLLRERNDIAPLSIVGHGDTVSFLGDLQKIFYTDKVPRRVVHEDEAFWVGGPADMAGKRLQTWLKAEAKTIISERAAHHADKLGVAFKRISIGDMKSRWGSCSSSGTLRFSWRLVMAPFEVLDYVAAHEVAHLREMNHSEAFWAHVEHCIPNHKAHRRWLKAEGNALFQVGFY